MMSCVIKMQLTCVLEKILQISYILILSERGHSAPPILSLLILNVHFAEDTFITFNSVRFEFTYN